MFLRSDKILFQAPSKRSAAKKAKAVAKAVEPKKVKVDKENAPIKRRSAAIAASRITEAADVSSNTERSTERAVVKKKKEKTRAERTPRRAKTSRQQEEDENYFTDSDLVEPIKTIKSAKKKKGKAPAKKVQEETKEPQSSTSKAALKSDSDSSDWEDVGSDAQLKAVTEVHFELYNDR